MSYSQAGHYDIQECILKSSSGVEIPDFEKQWVSIQLHENIFSNGMHGELTVVDTNYLPMNMPLTGQDFITLKFTTPDIEEQPIIDHVFYITQLLAREEISNGAITYTFKLISPETLRDNRVRVTSSYTDTPSEVIENVLKNLLKSTKNMTIEGTTGIRKYVSPYSRPFDFIKSLTRESVSSKTSSPHYLFYESTKGYHFVTTDYLYSVDRVAKFEPSDSSLLPHGMRDIEKDLNNILSYNISDSTNTVAAARGGMLGSRLIVYNIFNKNYELTDHDYLRDFNNFNRINENPIYNDNEIEEGKKIGSFPNSNINLHPTSKSDGIDARYNENLTDNQSEKWLLPLRSKIMELSMGQSINLTVHGRADIAVGDKVHITLPITGKTHGDSEIDKVFEGDCLVTHLKHVFENVTKEHLIHMTATQDAIPHSYDIIADSTEPKKQGTITKV